MNTVHQLLTTTEPSSVEHSRTSTGNNNQSVESEISQSNGEDSNERSQPTEESNEGSHSNEEEATNEEQSQSTGEERTTSAETNSSENNENNGNLYSIFYIKINIF